MITNCFSIYDSKARVFSTPFFAITKEVALRMFMEGANDPSTQLNRHSEDFTLFHVGTFDDDRGILVALEISNINLGLAANFKGV